MAVSIIRRSVCYSFVCLAVFLFILVVSLLLPYSKAGAFTEQQLIRGSEGYDVYELQGRLRYVRYYHGPIDGKFGWQTYWAVRNFERDVHIRIDGIAGPVLKEQLVKRTRGYRTEMYSKKPHPLHEQKAQRHMLPPGKVNHAAEKITTPGTYHGKLSAHDINLLEHCVYGEARGEPFIGQVAVAATVLNRLNSPLFPHTIAGILFQPGAFTCTSDGQFWLTPNNESHRAVMDALQGWDPSNGALYYFNPSTATSKWIWSRPQIKQIGKHIFTR